MIPGAGVHLWKQRRAYCRHVHDDVTPSYYRSSSSLWNEQLSVAGGASSMDQTAREARQRLDEKLRHIRTSRLNQPRKEKEMIIEGNKTLAGDPDDWKQLLGGVLRDIMSLM